VFNYLAQQKDFEYDKNDEIAKSGNINMEILEQLNSLDYYSQLHPKYLGREWLEEVFIPIIEKSDLSIDDKMRTCAEHISIQIAKSFSEDISEELFTGGGALNRFLMKLIKEKTNCKITIPDELLINYKEALIFAFLGVLRINNEVNVLSFVTGAKKNHSSGSIIN
jgi:anhydro-N-acetylmuramic acid kinase